METADENGSLATVTNGDESLQAAMDSQQPPASHSSPPTLTELRLVLLGRKGTGKSSAGNTILGGAGGFESGKPTEECVKRRADVVGRKVTVVDTPGWEWYYPLNGNPNWVRRETLRSVSLCPPGPHAVLLVVRSCTSVTDDYIKEIEEHVEPLGKQVWEHTMVLFTRGDELGLGSMEQRILTSGPGLQRLLQKCGNRYHVVNNRSKGDLTQVKELIRKLEDMVDRKKHGNHHLEMDNTVLLGLEADGKRRARERRKKQRQMEAQIQRGTIKAAVMSDGPQGSELDAHHSFSKAPRRLHEVRLVLLGERETGKSSAGSTILGKMGFFEAGAVTEECICQQAEVAMRLVTVVDTPGWEAGVAGATPERVKREIVCSVTLCPPGPHAILLTLRVDTLVTAGHVREHLELLGEGVWRHTILLFTHGDQLREGVDIEQHIQGGGRDLQWLLQKCRGRYHVISSLDGGGGGRGCFTKVTELLEKVEKMATMNRCEAFLSLVQEVRDLSQQRNEKFNQRMKEMGDKLLRQEAELKNMREREVKRIRWFFNRDKKVKSPGKADIQREEEDEDRRVDERKNDLGELEERMRWLTEDREKEIQDLSLANERIRVALNKSQQDMEEAMLKLELREREIEDLKERTDEQQLKLVDVERTLVEMKHERKQMDEAIRVKTQELEEVEEAVELLSKEKSEWIEQFETLKLEMDENKILYDESLERKEEEKNRQIADIEQRLNREMEKQQEELKQKASEEQRLMMDNAKKDTESKIEEIKSKHQKATEQTMQDKETEIKEIKLQHQEEMHRKVSELEKLKKEMDNRLEEKAHDLEKIKQEHDEEIQELQRENQRQITQLKDQQMKQIAELEKKHHNQMQESKKDKELMNLNYKKDLEQQLQEREKELEALKLKHREELKQQLAEETEKQLQERQRLITQLKDQQMKQIAELEQKHHAELQESKKDKELMNLNYKKDMEQQLQEREREKRKHQEELKQQLAEETEKQLQERQRLITECEQKCAAKIEEIELEHVKEKDLLNQNLKKLDKITEELRHQLKSEAEEREKEKERHEKELEEMKRNIKDMEEKLQQNKENERQHEKDIQARERENEAIKEHLREREEQLQHTEKERERDRLNHKKQMQQTVEEKERVIEKLKQHIKDVDEILQRKEEERGEIILNQKREAEQRLHDKEREMEEMKVQLLNEMEGKLQDKEAEIESVKQQADMREARWREEQKRKDEQGAMEMNKLMETINKKTNEVTQVQSLIAQRDCELEEAKRMCETHLKDIQALREGNEKITSSLVETQQSYLKKLGEKEEELDRLSQKDSDNQKEIIQLKLCIEQTKTELKELTCRMEREMTSMIQEYEKEIEIKNEDVASVAKVKDGIISRLEQQSSVVKEKYEQSQKKVDEMQEQNEKIRIETENLKIKYEELKKESEEEVRRYEEKVRNIEAEIQTIHKEKEMEVKALKEANLQLQAETERMKERESESEKQMKELREHFQRECKQKDEAIKEKLEREESEREQILRRNEEEVRKRGCDLNAKQEELVEKEEKLESKERELGTIQASLEKRKAEQEKYEQDVKLKEQNVRKKEQDLERLLEALEGRQKELSSHGQDLQKKVKGLKNQGKELKDREYYLKNEEQELLNWKSELQMRNEHVNYTTQQLDEMGRDLALLKEELHNKEKNLKESLKKLNKWEQNLTEREEKLSRREQRDLQNGQCSPDDDAFYLMTAAEGSKENLPLTYKEVSERKGRGKERDREERREDEEDLRMETAPSAAESSNCHPETLQEKEGSGTETRNKLLSQGHIRSKDSDLRVVVLGETWSSRSPAGVTILGGEASKFDGSSFRPWRGQIAGRRLAVVEPLGLRWRDGLDAANASQQKSILDSMSWCHPGPHIILLLIPAFLTCTKKYRRAVEEHMRLLGEETWRRTLVVFTWGETLGESAEQHILRNGELMGLVERCEGRYHVLTSKKSNSRIEGLFEKIEDMLTLNNGGEL